MSTLDGSPKTLEQLFAELKDAGQRLEMARKEASTASNRAIDDLNVYNGITKQIDAAMQKTARRRSAVDELGRPEGADAVTVYVEIDGIEITVGGTNHPEGFDVHSIHLQGNAADLKKKLKGTSFFDEIAEAATESAARGGGWISVPQRISAIPGMIQPDRPWPRPPARQLAVELANFDVGGPQMKTREEVDDLKNQWLRDPSWTLAETGDFEEYTVELAAFEAEHAALWQAAREKSEAAAYRNTPASEATLRDMFASYALNAMGHTLAFYANEPATLAQVVKTAYQAADAMMAARKGGAS